MIVNAFPRFTKSKLTARDIVPFRGYRRLEGRDTPTKRSKPKDTKSLFGGANPAACPALFAGIPAAGGTRLAHETDKTQSHEKSQFGGVNPAVRVVGSGNGA